MNGVSILVHEPKSTCLAMVHEVKQQSRIQLCLVMRLRKIVPGWTQDLLFETLQMHVDKIKAIAGIFGVPRQSFNF